MVARKSFDGIISALTYDSYALSQDTMFVVWWMDTTHTFHLPFGEMTITPLDFVAIIRLSFSGEPIPISNKAYSSIVMQNR